MAITYRALAVGINDYPGTGADLMGCVNDATDWAGALHDRGYQVDMLLNSSATKTAVVSVLQRLISESKRSDRIVFTYSGHGTWVPDKDGDEADRRDEALVLYDYRDGGLLLDDELQRLFEPAIAKGVRVIILSDSCHSGSVSRVLNDRRSDPQAQPRFLPPSTFLTGEQLTAAVRVENATSTDPSRPGAVLISGCDDHQYSYDVQDGRPHGAFTAAALATLPAVRSYAGWHKAIRKLLPNPATPQDPQLTATLRQRSMSSPSSIGQRAVTLLLQQDTQGEPMVMIHEPTRSSPSGVDDHRAVPVHHPADQVPLRALPPPQHRRRHRPGHQPGHPRPGQAHLRPLRQGRCDHRRPRHATVRRRAVLGQPRGLPLAADDQHRRDDRHLAAGGPAAALESPSGPGAGAQAERRR